MDVGLFIYINGILKQIDTFDDEPISVTSSLQNVNDITKVFTDYSQSFSVPISKNNNLIFNHWYNNEVDNGFDQRLRYDGFIEIDSQVFRVGRWQIESSDVTKSYKLTFFGVLKSLADKFGEDKLKDLDYSDINFDYTFTNVLNRVTSINNDVQFPLITSGRVWTYGTGSTTDISQNSHAIDYKELFPAVSLPRLFQCIEDKYNVTFTGNFIQQNRFKNAFLWFKNREETNVLSFPQPMFITSFTTIVANSRWIPSTGTSGIQYLGVSNSAIGGRLRINITIGAGIDWIVRIFRNGVFFADVEGTGTQSNVTLIENNSTAQNSQYIGQYTFQIITSDPTSVSYVFTMQSLLLLIGLISHTATGNVTTTNFLDHKDLAPDLSIKDFFNGIVKQFNLIVESFDEQNYKLLPLDEWYSLGQTKDITEFVINESEVERFKVFKKINFKNQQSNSFVNVAFEQFYQRKYGDLTAVFDNEGGELTIETPFEALIFDKLADWLLVGYSVDNNGNKYVPKPCLIYRTTSVPIGVAPFYITGSPATLVNSYVPFSRLHIQLFSNNNFSLDWGAETFQQGGATITNSAYWLYYSNYLSNLYQKKTRIVKLSAILPTTELLKLKLNDFVVIQDKRYLINQFTTNFLTKKVDFELITDFRDVTEIKSRTFTIENNKTISIDLLDGEDTVTIDSDPSSIIASFDLRNGGVVVLTHPTNVGLAILKTNYNNQINIIVE